MLLGETETYQETDITTLIQSRRSIRYGFAEREVPSDAIEQIVKSGLAAPSSKNAQPWHIHVVRERDDLCHLSDLVNRAKAAERFLPIDPRDGKPRQWKSTVAESARILGSASLGLFIENTGEFSSGRAEILKANGNTQKSALIGYGFEMIGLGALVQNMWLTAHYYGLAGVFMGDVVAAEESIRRNLGMTGDLVGVLAVGYTIDQPVNKTIKDSYTYH